MTTIRVNASRLALATVSTGVRIVIDGREVGPVLTKRAARVVQRWLDGGGLHAFEGQDDGSSKLARTLGAVDVAADALHDLFTNGLR